MLQLAIELHPNGCLKSLSASGHTDFAPSGSDIVCAAATCLIRTAVRILSGESDLTSSGSAAHSGELTFFLDDPPRWQVERVLGMTDFLLIGLTDLEREYPGALEIINERVAQ